MKGRESRGPPAATDLLVCFPTRAHLSLLPKRICSPARPPESSALPRHQRRPSQHHLRNRASSHGSPQLWAKSKQNQNNNADNSEPSSPKVTCAGQIKVRTKPNSCKNWQSVMEEIERLHNHRKNKKKGAWVEAFGFKKDVMHFLTCLRNIRFDFRCFGAVPASDVDEEDDDDDDDDDDHDQDSRDVFSKWFTILQEDNSRGKVMRPCRDEEEEEEPEQAAPPANALLLMRCRSAPAKSWLEEKEEERRGGEIEEELSKTDFCEEIRVVGQIQSMISRSRSWRR